MPGITFVPFLESQMGGAIVVNVFAILCTLALLSVALRVIWLAIRRFLVRNIDHPQEYVFFHTQLGNYAACLLIAMMFNSLAGMMGIPWLVNRGITQGPVCIAQGYVMQVGTWSSGYFTVTIAIHTFNSLVLRRKQSAIISRTAISVGWALSLLMGAIPFIVPQPDGDVYGADGFMCGLRDTYPKLQFLLHLLPILIASILSAIFYSIVFLTLRGTLKIKGGIKLTLDPNERWTNTKGENYHRFIARVARSMIWYPVAYVALLVPYSVMRLLGISGFRVPFEAMVFACTCWFALGVVNVVLLYNTFRILGPAFDARSMTSTRTVSFGTSGFLEKAGSKAFSTTQRTALQEKIDQYNASFGYRTSTPESFSHQSVHSAQYLLPVHNRNASQQSYYSYPSSPAIGQAILPTSEYSRPIPSPEPTFQKPYIGSSPALGHIRQESTSSQGLPAPPRRTRSPTIFQPQSAESIEGREPLSHQSSSDTLGSTTFGVNRTRSSSPSHERSISNDSFYGTKPSFSAFAPSFPTPASRSPPRQLTLLAGRTSPTTDTSRPFTAPSSGAGFQRPGQRPLLLSRGLSMDTSDLTYSNPRMPPSPPQAYRS